ncbi:MAG: ABC transporter ATP-binding protein [Propionibacteriaceae bacterium]
MSEPLPEWSATPVRPATKPPTGTPLLELHDVDVEIPLDHGVLHAVRGVSLTASAGQSVGLVGESGSGKSLTLRAAMDLLPVPARITGGSIVVNGVDVTGLSPARRREHLSSVMAMIFQDSLTALNPTMRIGDQVAEVPRRRLGMSRADAHARAIDLLSQVGIRDPERRYRAFPHELSGGMRQRVCIAIALSADPGLILADEPTTALDVTIQAQVLGVLAELRQERGVGLVLVTHDLAVVSGTCEELNVMYAGRIVEHGRTDVLLDSPRHPYTAALLRSVPDPDQPVHRLLTIAGQPPDLMEPIPGCAFAPRCAAVVDRCLTERPPLDRVSLSAGGRDHTSACWRSHEPENWPTELAEAAIDGVLR